LGAIGTDAIFACNARRASRLLSQYVPTYQYEFNDPNAPMLFLPPVSFPTGAYHASELQYIFSFLETPVPSPGLTTDQAQLSEIMSGIGRSSRIAVIPTRPERRPGRCTVPVISSNHCIRRRRRRAQASRPITSVLSGTSTERHPRVVARGPERRWRGPGTRRG